MAKQTINLGTGELTGDGESIRSAFDKINDNFDELYARDATDVDLSSVNQSIIPDTDVTYDLGSADKRFRDLYLSGSTIDLGGTTLSVVGGALQVDGSPVVSQSDLTGYVTQAQLAAGSITVNATGDVQGSVFADDSTLLVDGVAGKIVGPVDALSVTAATITTSSLITAADGGINTQGGTLTLGGGDIDAAGTIAAATVNAAAFNGPLTGNVVGDVVGSVFSDDSSVMVDAVNNTLHAGTVNAVAFSGSLFTNGGVNAPLQIFSGQNDQTGNTIFINPYGSDTYLLQQAETHEWRTGAYLSSGNPYVQFKTAGAFKALNGAYFDGDIRSEGNINVEVNLSDSTTHTWRFGEDGDLTFPNGQQIDATDADLLLIGTSNAGLKLNSVSQSALLTAKKSFERGFLDVDEGTFTAVPGDPPKIIVQIANNEGAYLRELLRRLEIKLLEENDDFPYAYNNVTIALRPDDENITANVILVEQSNSDPLEYEITIDQDPTSVVGNLDVILISYDYENTIGVDVDRDIFGIATDNDDIDIISGRDIDLRAGDDISILANSTFDLTLARNDYQNDNDGIDINTEDPNGVGSWRWTFQFDGNLSVPGAIISDGSDLELSSTTDVNINTSVGDEDHVFEFAGDGTFYMAKNPTGNISYISTPRNDSSANLNLISALDLTITTNESDVTKEWVFGRDGSLTLADSISFGSANGYEALVDEGGTLYFKGTDSDNDIIVRTNASGGGQNDFIFGKDASLTLPDSGNIEAFSSVTLKAYYGPPGSNHAWQFNGASGTVRKTTSGYMDIGGPSGVKLTATGETTKIWTFDGDGSLTLPGAVVSTPESPAGGTDLVGEATAITVTNSPNANWTTGTGAFVNGITFGISVDGSGNATVTSISDGGTGHFVGETFGPLPGTALGGSSPADDIYFEVTAIAESRTALSLTKQVQILEDGFYTLADGTEGQIMYFVPASGTSTGTYVNIANARIIDVGDTDLPVDDTDYSWTPFFGETEAPRTIAMAIFADGAWCLRGGVTD